MSEVVLLKISGEDRPGITFSLTEILAEHEVRILDVGQAVIHDLLSLGILIEAPPGFKAPPLFKDLLARAEYLEVKLDLIPISPGKYEEWVRAQGKKRHIVTLLAREITAGQISRIAGVISANDLNIDVITRLSGRISLQNPSPLPRACVEFSVRGRPRDIDAMRKDFLEISKDMEVDIAFQEDNVFRRNRRLVAFDMDSTLIQAEIIDELAKVAGAAKKVSAVTEAAMRGDMDFKKSLRQRVRCLAGLDASALATVAGRVSLTEGAERLISNLKSLGLKVAILSGGFTYFGERLKKKLGIDYLFANELEIKNGKLTGEVLGDIVDGEKKAALLTEIAHKEGISLQQVVAVGDGANDLPMLSIAGLGIAFHAKPKVKEGARQSISTLGLDGILYLLGLRDREALTG